MMRFKNVLYVSEGAVDQADAVARAVSFAKSNQAALTVLDVLPEKTVRKDAAPDDLVARLELQRRQQLESLFEPYRDMLPVRIEVARGKCFLETIRSVLRHNHELVIKPAQNPAWLTRIFGSDDMHLLRKCPCPVWLMKSPQASVYRRIVAAIDFDPDDPGSVPQDLNANILQLAGSLAIADSAELHMVHAWDTPEAGLIRLWADNPEVAEGAYLRQEQARHTAGLDALRVQLPHWIGAQANDYIDPQFHLLRGDPPSVIASFVQDIGADLLVMGTVARSGIAGLFIGNTAEAILDQLQCSVLALKPAGFVTPVTLPT